MKKKQWLLANWKMCPTLLESQHWIKVVLESPAPLHTWVIFPPSVQISVLQNGSQTAPWSWGIQDISAHTIGAHTGEISASMCREQHIQYALVGHSETRQACGYTHESIIHKAERALEVGMTPVVCIGEPEAVYQAGKTLDFLVIQLSPMLNNIKLWKTQSWLLAYEPIWSIGTGHIPTLEGLTEVMEGLQDWLEYQGLQPPLLYGGSVKPENIKTLSSISQLSGFLVGGASLNPSTWLEMSNLL